MFMVYRNRYNVTQEITSKSYRSMLLSHLGEHDYVWHIEKYPSEIFLNDTCMVLPTSLKMADHISYFVFDYDPKTYSYISAMNKETTLFEYTSVGPDNLLEKMIEFGVLV